MKEINLPDFYFHFQVSSLKFLGIDVLTKNESLAYRIYSMFALVFTGSFVFVECIELIFHSDFNGMAHVCNYAISHFLGMIKVIVLYRNRKQIGDMLVSLHEGVYKPNEERGGSFEKQCINDTIKTTIFLMWVYAWSIIVVVCLGLTSSIQTRFSKPPEMWRLPFSYISFVDISYSPSFELTFLYQITGIFMITLCVYTSDVTIIAIIAQASAQLKILENSVRTYIQRGLKRQKILKLTDEACVDLTLKETIYNHHHAILDTVDTIESLGRYLALCVFLANLVLLCLLMYKTSMLPLGGLQFFMYLCYCFLIAIQVFLYCWWGNEMTLANESLALGISQTYTPDTPISHAMALKLMMIRSQRTLCLTAGKFAPLSLETYKGIIKGSFSYFMVLRQVNSK
ncbi:hypothetical protein RN001_004061 [Aquatica leii]|uniref:Odorant receptor n=1 Tax=Aquatica leii TaxID=1421715 RepID=A0AAN7ST52_9COLE|nr:hypothetical protein RN001_004061 [Aquatica leii]